ncbi:MAG: hypothetical protein EOS72_01910 [Mesorhizobium sp.]|uniref:hypothetical protein n=1 Tax=Mesorhizobium sp. TaxID=1871066 RepID=UPI000FE840E4|nr:hypothetical protein [Mesorhizobium sp.]RWC92299.1 MAG: hypothetical protein EOS72_01910 [Mesorhizobium sp.]
MEEPIKTFDLSPEQQNTTVLIHRLLGKRIADRYVDFCRLAAGAFPLRVSSPIAAHALRELESILRQTLEVPMEVSVTPSPDDIQRIGKAKAQLQALGYNEDEIQRASSQLGPRLSHKQQIDKIVSRLDLAPSGDIAHAWKSISQAHSQAHGGRALDQSFVVNDAFRTRWQAPFDTVIRGLMIALQGKYAAFMQRIDQLVAMPDRGAAVTSFSKEIPGALPLLSHFFDKLETPDWLPQLAKRNLLAAPLSQADQAGDDGSFLRQWPAARYLLRMAKSTDPKTRALVADTLRKVAASSHPDVQQMGIEILAALPPGDAAPLVGLAEGWLTSDAHFVVAQAPHDLITRLAQGGEGSAALRVARAVFKVYSEDDGLTTLFPRHMYEHYLPSAVKAIAPVCKVDAVALLADLLDQALHFSGKVKDNPPHDYSYYTSGEISEHGPKHDVIDGLIGEIVRASKLTIEADPARTHDTVMRIRSHSSRLFARIALHVLSLNPAGARDVAQALLTDRDLIEETWCRIEYGELARAWFPSLPAPIQQEILTYVDSMPEKHRDGFNQRFEQHQNRPPTQEEQQKYNETIVRDLLWHWREVLPSDRRERIENLGDPDAWRQRIYEPDKAPLTAPDFYTHPLNEIVSFLYAWQPPSGEKRETVTAIAEQLRKAAEANAGLYSSGAELFVQLPRIYVRHLLEGFTNASINNNDLDWKSTLALIQAIALPSRQRLPSSIEGDDPDWSWAQKAAIKLLASGLRRGAEGIPFAHAGLLEVLILQLYRAAPRQPDTENFEESYRIFPHFGAQSTWRGAAIELSVLLVFWLSKDDEGEVGKSPREALVRLPAIRKVFETELTDRSADGRIPRAILGRYLNWLHYFAESWLVQHIPILFPEDDLSLRDAGWLSHLCADSGPTVDLAPAMCNCYMTEIQRLAVDSSERDRQDVDTRLAEYLVILYLNAALPDEVFRRFWDTAPVRSRQHAIWFLGIMLELPRDRIAEDARARAFSYWNRRLEEARASATPDYFRKEVGAVGSFFFREAIPVEWLMDQLLSMSEAGFAPNESFNVMERLVKLSPDYPDRSAEVLSALVKNDHLESWVYTGQPASTRTIFTNGLATGSPATAAAITIAINYLASRGHTGYLDLLPNPSLKNA